MSIPATSTPREAITFSARLRLDKNIPDSKIDSLVNDILENLNLSECADRLIGGGPLLKGGLSGGERKRVQCGVELVTHPEIVVLDEPTSGLDSYSAQQLVEVLHRISEAGATVIVTIHQPPPPVVRLIDNLLLLLDGRLMYNGEMGEPVGDYFSAKGYPRPDDYNIADWILEVAQTNKMDTLEAAGFFDENVLPSQSGKVDAKEGGAFTDSANLAASSDNHVGFMKQTRMLFDREVKNLVRDKLALVIRVGSTVAFGLLFGLIFFGIGRSDYIVFAEVQGSYGAMANLLISTMFGVAQSSLMVRKGAPVPHSPSC